MRSYQIIGLFSNNFKVLPTFLQDYKNSRVYRLGRIAYNIKSNRQTTRTGAKRPYAAS
jgi:hypothetical protein